jgi:hypothetical protein
MVELVVLVVPEMVVEALEVEAEEPVETVELYL